MMGYESDDVCEKPLIFKGFFVLDELGMNAAGVKMIDF